MIGSNTKGCGFGGLLGYLLDTRRGRILDSNLGHETPAGMAREFRAIANRRPTAQKVVRHFATAEDGAQASDLPSRMGKSPTISKLRLPNSY